MTASVCPACDAEAFVSSGDGGTCSRCGYASGSVNRCPHCGASARAEASGERLVCAMCGGPRVPDGIGGARAAAALREEHKELAVSRAASLATVAQALLAGLVTVIALLISSPTWKMLVFLLAASTMLSSVRSRMRAASARKRAKAAGERAWHAAAEEVAAESASGISALELSTALGIDEARADALLTSLAVHDRVRVDVDEAPDVRYRLAREYAEGAAFGEHEQEHEPEEELGRQERAR